MRGSLAQGKLRSPGAKLAWRLPSEIIGNLSNGVSVKLSAVAPPREEDVIVAPFQQTLRLESRVRTVPAPKPEAEHPIVRAQKWQRMLESGEMRSRFALAKRAGVDPAMVTRVLKLLRLAPDIQEYLATLRTSSALWHFNIKTLGELADLLSDKQRAAFARISARFDERSRELQSIARAVPIAPSAKPSWRGGSRLAAG